MSRSRGRQKRHSPKRRGGGIAAALKRFILESGLTYKELARKTGIGLTTIYRLSYGECGNMATADRIANVLGLELRRRRKSRG